MASFFPQDGLVLIAPPGFSRKDKIGYKVALRIDYGTGDGISLLKENLLAQVILAAINVF